MNMEELAAKVAAATGHPVADSKKATSAVFDALRDALASGDGMVVKGFGSFGISERKARTGRNPRTGEALQIPASKSVSFKAAKALKDAVN